VREIGVIGVLLLEIALFAFLVRRSSGGNDWVFLGRENLLGIVLDAAIIGIAAIGVATVIISGGIDLSVGGVIALSSVVLAGALLQGIPVPLAIGAALLSGVLSGACAAVLVTWVELPPFIATLALMLITRGMAFVISGGNDRSIGAAAPGFTDAFGDGGVLGVPYLVLLLLSVALCCAYSLGRSVWGRQVFAVGGNEIAARYAGVAVHKIKWSVYLLSGVLAALAGVVFAAKYGTGRANAAMGYELDAVAAAVVGGASLSGGRGSILGAVLGALIFTTLRTGLNQITGAATYQDVIIGGVVIAAVVTDRLIQKRVTR
jgi:ribose transport system permease protein